MQDETIRMEMAKPKMVNGQCSMVNKKDNYGKQALGKNRTGQQGDRALHRGTRP
jgi:hypothetical protein